TLDAHARRLADVVKTGRTHLMDATPVTLGQDVSGWAAQLARARRHLDAAAPGLCELAIGGTAVGTGLNTHPEFGARVAARSDAPAIDPCFISTTLHTALKESRSSSRRQRPFPINGK
ncbi:MAG TPA: lyase family protein, partial [Parvularculaceae bacterium]|nr:lyase family protein [Parvularculaceae bacterium]